MSQLTVEGVAAGTPGYIAPEVALGDADVDARADLYALGCVAYVLLTGTLVFPDPNPLSMTLKHVQARAGSAVAADGAADSARSRADRFLQCLEKNPADRPASARELDESARQSAAPPIGPSATPPTGGSSTCRSRRRCGRSLRRRRARRRWSRRSDYEHVRAAHAGLASGAALTPVLSALQDARRALPRVRSSGCSRCSRTSGPARVSARCCSPSTSSCCWPATR